MSSAASISITVRPSALRRALPYAAMFVGALVLGAAGAVAIALATDILLAGIFALMVLWALLPFWGYKILRKREEQADRKGPLVLLEDGFLTFPRRGGPDLGVDVQEAVLCAFVLQVWARAYVNAEGEVVTSNLRQQFGVLQLQQPKMTVRFMAELNEKIRLPELPRLHRVPMMPDVCQVERVEVWPDDLVNLLAALRRAGMRETEARLQTNRSNP